MNSFTDNAVESRALRYLFTMLVKKADTKLPGIIDDMIDVALVESIASSKYDSETKAVFKRAVSILKESHVL